MQPYNLESIKLISTGKLNLDTRFDFAIWHWFVFSVLLEQTRRQHLYLPDQSLVIKGDYKLSIKLLTATHANELIGLGNITNLSFDEAMSLVTNTIFHKPDRLMLSHFKQRVHNAYQVR